jgi:hypothetical protein
MCAADLSADSRSSPRTGAILIDTFSAAVGSLVCGVSAFFGAAPLLFAAAVVLFLALGAFFGSALVATDLKATTVPRTNPLRIRDNNRIELARKISDSESNQKDH